MSDPLRHKVRFVRLHWRCLLDAILTRDPEAARIDYAVHMVRYAKAGR